MDRWTERELAHYRARNQRKAESEAATLVAKREGIASGKVIPLYESCELTGLNYRC